MSDPTARLRELLEARSRLSDRLREHREQAAGLVETLQPAAELARAVAALPGYPVKLRELREIRENGRYIDLSRCGKGRCRAGDPVCVADLTTPLRRADD